MTKDEVEYKLISFVKDLKLYVRQNNISDSVVSFSKNDLMEISSLSLSTLIKLVERLEGEYDKHSNEFKINLSKIETPAEYVVASEICVSLDELINLYRKHYKIPSSKKIKILIG